MVVAPCEDGANPDMTHDDVDKAGDAATNNVDDVDVDVDEDAITAAPPSHDECCCCCCSGCSSASASGGSGGGGALSPLSLSR